jgi:glycosyltransferase involved in cell wall biosynthesis
VNSYRILEVVSGFGLGGAEKALSERMKYMPDSFEQLVLNVRPEIDAFNPHPDFIEKKIHEKGIPRIVGIGKFLKEHHFDFWIVRTPLDAIRFSIFKVVLRKSTCKLVFEAHSNFVSKRPIISFLLKILLRFSASKIDLVIPVSENVRKGPLCKGHKNVRRIYLGSRLDFFDSSIYVPKAPHLLFVGRLVALKRPIWLLERIHNLQEKIQLPEPTLTIVGSGNLEGELIQFLERHGLKKYVNYVGSQENVAPYFAAATHLVSCSTNEGLPLTFFEAKLAGLSILSTPSGGGYEIFEEEDLELKSFDEVEFETALIQIITSPPPTLEKRKSIQAKSKWMNSEDGAKRYYLTISDLFSR